ncbi:hypothetical protein B0E53_06867 [Micromonospora sp. MH33]|nr:hypothetical protein B0E53_06867 [Micromonospora sp. MH33]
MGRRCEETISRITDKVIEEMTDWSRRPLDEIYAAVFIDAIIVKGAGSVAGCVKRSVRE